MKENKVIIITMILNLIVAIIKFASGIIFSFSNLENKSETYNNFSQKCLFLQSLNSNSLKILG